MPEPDKFVPGYLALSRPKGAKVYELMIAARDVVGATAKVTRIFSEFSVNIIASHSRTDWKTGDYIHLFFCDFAKAKVQIAGVAKELRKLKFMKEVRFVDVSNSIHEKFLFPILAGTGRRVIIIDASAFLSIERRMAEMLGSGGEVLLFEEGKAYVADSFRGSKLLAKELGAEWDLANAIDLFRASGWGLFRFRQSAEGYVITVKNPLSPDGAHVRSRFLEGAAVGALEYFTGARYAVVGAEYDKTKDTLQIRASKQTGK